MQNLQSLTDLIGINSEQIEIPFTLFNFFLTLVISMIIRYFYINYSTSLSGKYHIGSVIPLLSSIVFLVIIIVKSSLALSLGLVGALSIVRFRTPIKEPEELAYLFLSIAVGLGFGAGYSLITSIIILLILLFIYLFLHKRESIITNEYNLIIEKNTKHNLNFDDLISNLTVNCHSIKFIRVDVNDQNKTIVLLITLREKSNIEDIVKSLADESVNLSFYESSTNW